MSEKYSILGGKIKIRSEYMRCYCKNKSYCYPKICPGAEIIPKVEKIESATGDLIERVNQTEKIKFYCMPNVRLIQVKSG